MVSWLNWINTARVHQAGEPLCVGQTPHQLHLVSWRTGRISDFTFVQSFFKSSWNKFPYFSSWSNIFQWHTQKYIAYFQVLRLFSSAPVVYFPFHLSTFPVSPSPPSSPPPSSSPLPRSPSRCVSVSGGWVAAVSHVSFDLCPSFDIENSWNVVLEQNEKPRAGGGGGFVLEKKPGGPSTHFLLSITSNINFSPRRSPSNCI